MEKNKLKLCIPGLMQLYYIDDKTLIYPDLESKIGLNIPEIKNFDSYQEYKNILTDILKPKSGIVDYLSKLIKNKLTVHYIEPNIVRKLEKQNFIIYNKNPLYLLIDEAILSHVWDKYCEKCDFLLDIELIKEVQNNKPKDYMIFDNFAKDLKIYRELGCWVTLLTNLVYTFYDIVPDSQIYKLINDNIEFIRNAGKLYDFTSATYYQNIYFHSIIEELNLNSENLIANYKEFHEYVDNLKLTKCLLFMYFSKRHESFQKKQKFFLSNQQVLYSTHIGGDDLSINGKFDCLIAKVIESKDYEHYKPHLDKFYSYTQSNNIKLINDFKIFPYLIKKDIMHHYMEDFCNSQSMKELNLKYGFKMSIPKSLIVKGEDIKTHDNFIKIMKENNFTFPLLVKYQSNNSFYFKHLATMIFNEESLSNYLDYFNSVYDIHLNCVLQSFVNHGGHVMKLYRISEENYIDWRSSLTDINEDFMKNYKDGFWTFKTKELESEEYRKLWRKFHGENMIEKQVNLEYLYSVLEKFEEYSGLTLYGLDLLYGYELNEYFLIDINAFPGYKIKGMDIPDKIAEHIVKYINK